MPHQQLLQQRLGQLLLQLRSRYLRVLGNEAGVGAYTLSLTCDLESVASLSQHYLHFRGLAIWCSVWNVRKLGGREASRGQGLNLSGPSCPRLLW